MMGRGCRGDEEGAQEVTKRGRHNRWRLLGTPTPHLASPLKGGRDEFGKGEVGWWWWVPACAGMTEKGRRNEGEGRGCDGSGRGYDGGGARVGDDVVQVFVFWGCSGVIHEASLSGRGVWGCSGSFGFVQVCSGLFGVLKGGRSDAPARAAVV